MDTITVKCRLCGSSHVYKHSLGTGGVLGVDHYSPPGVGTLVYTLTCLNGRGDYEIKISIPTNTIQTAIIRAE